MEMKSHSVLFGQAKNDRVRVSLVHQTLAILISPAVEVYSRKPALYDAASFSSMVVANQVVKLLENISKRMHPIVRREEGKHAYNAVLSPNTRQALEPVVANQVPFVAR